MSMLYPNLCYNKVCYKGTALQYESAYDKTNTIISASREDSEQPGYQHSKVWVFAMHS